MDKHQQNVGIAQTGMHTKDIEEVVRNQRQEHQHKLKDQLNEEQRACKYSNFSPNYSHNQLHNIANAVHEHNHGMGNLAVMTNDQIQGDIVKKICVQKE